MSVTAAIFLYHFFQITLEPEETLLPINWILLMVISGIISLVMGGFTAWHMSLVLRNYTTIESMEETRFKGDQTQFAHYKRLEDNGNVFDLGYRRNWEQVFGVQKLGCFLPIKDA